MKRCRKRMFKNVNKQTLIRSNTGQTIMDFITTSTIVYVNLTNKTDSSVSPSLRILVFYSPLLRAILLNNGKAGSIFAFDRKSIPFQMQTNSVNGQINAYNIALINIEKIKYLSCQGLIILGRSICVHMSLYSIFVST